MLALIIALLLAWLSQSVALTGWRVVALVLFLLWLIDELAARETGSR